MQKRGRALKIQMEFDGEVRPGLNKCTGLKAEMGELEVAENGRKYFIIDGQISYPAIEGAHLDQDGSGNREFFRDWFQNKTLKDVTYIELDGHGTEIRRTLLPDCECFKATTVDYDAGGPSVHLVEWKIGYYEPVNL